METPSNYIENKHELPRNGVLRRIGIINSCYFQEKLYFCHKLSSQKTQMESIGEILRSLRESHQQLLREVSAGVAMDQALLSKIERGERFPTKEQVLKLAKYFHAEKNELIVAWLSDKLVNELAAKEALKVAEQKINKRNNHGK
jgi:transcriptional regulator with XRE-family HTH domain